MQKVVPNGNMGTELVLSHYPVIESRLPSEQGHKFVWESTLQPNTILREELRYKPSKPTNNKAPQFGWLKQYTFIFSQIWRLDVSDQGAGRANFFANLSLTCRWLLCIFGLPSVYVS